jgi:hypothetical protein
VIHKVEEPALLLQSPRKVAVGRAAHDRVQVRLGLLAAAALLPGHLGAQARAHVLVDVGLRHLAHHRGPVGDADVHEHVGVGELGEARRRRRGDDGRRRGHDDDVAVCLSARVVRSGRGCGCSGGGGGVCRRDPAAAKLVVDRRAARLARHSLVVEAEPLLAVGPDERVVVSSVDAARMDEDGVELVRELMFEQEKEKREREMRKSEFF